VFIPTVYFSRLTASVTTDFFGDERDVFNEVESGIPAHLYDKEQTVFVPADGKFTTVRKPVAILSTDQAVSKGDALKDEATNELFYVDNVVVPKTFVSGGWGKRVELRRAT
jgi:hypothetical protein